MRSINNQRNIFEILNEEEKQGSIYSFIHNKYGGKRILKKVCGNCVYWSSTKLEHVTCKKCSKDKRSIERLYFMPLDMNCPVCEYEITYNSKDVFLEREECSS